MLEELAVFPDALVMRDAITANEIMRIPINTASFKKQFSFPYGVIYRPDLLNVLKRACEQFSNIKIIFNKRALTTRQTETSASVICEDQSSYDAEAIIGADGLWSEIRKNIARRFANIVHEFTNIAQKFTNIAQEFTTYWICLFKN